MKDHLMIRKMTLALCAGMLLALIPATAQDAPDPAELLNKAMAHASSQARLAVDGQISIKLAMQGRNDEFTFDLRIELGPDNAAYYYMKSPEDSAEMISDGKTLVTHLIEDKKYMEEKAPATRAKIFGQMPGGPARLNTEWVGRFLSNDSGLIAELQDLRYSGVEAVDGVACHKLEAGLTDGPATFWIQQEGSPYLLQMLVDLSDEQQGATFLSNLALRNWNAAPEFAENRFAFAAPEGAEKMLSPREQMAQQPPDPMVGKEAPALKSPMLDGTPFDLASYEGKNIVILDFWATWCGPCRQGLPIVSKIAQDYADKGVKFFAVNIGVEDAETVNAFLDKTGMKDLPVVHDEEAKSGADFKAESIPRTVVVDKDGIIRVVHAGISPWFDEELREQLDALLAGSKEVK